MKARIKIKKVNIQGKRLALEVEFDTGETFWYITTTERTKKEITDILTNLYESIQATKTNEYKTKIEKLKKELEGLEIKV